MLMLASAIALAQVSKGSISGTVVDPSGAAVVEAEVRVTALDTNQVSSSVTGGTGGFKLSLLPVGVYKLEIVKAGFRKMFLGNLTVVAGVDTGLGEIKVESDQPRRRWKSPQVRHWSRQLKHRLRTLSNPLT